MEFKGRSMAKMGLRQRIVTEDYTKINVEFLLRLQARGIVFSLKP